MEDEDFDYPPAEMSEAERMIYSPRSMATLSRKTTPRAVDIREAFPEKIKPVQAEPLAAK